MDLSLLQQLLKIKSPSGSEGAMSDFIRNYFESQAFKVKPVIHYGTQFQDCLAVAFGKPRAAVFAHMDTVGFTVRYDNELVEIGSPDARTGDKLTGISASDPFTATVTVEDEAYTIAAEIDIPRGAEMVYEAFFEEKEGYITSPYLDNRIGLWNTLSLAKDLENGLLVFTAWEEHKGGSAGMMGKFIYEEYGIYQTLISDITYATHGIKHGDGAVISIRDSGIPRRSYVDKIQTIAKSSGIPFQLEVESYGGSDGNELQKLPYPIDWCFVGAPCSNMHSSREHIYLPDVLAMNKLYKRLLEEL